MDYFLHCLYPQKVVNEGYKHKKFLLAPLAALFYRLSHIKMASLSMIAMITTHNSNYYRLKILVTHMDFVITFVILATLKNYD